MNTVTIYIYQLSGLGTFPSLVAGFYLAFVSLQYYYSDLTGAHHSFQTMLWKRDMTGW